jgi:O-acetyl-ADP-ribose deacetylase (regulator of RNase III)
MMFGEHTISMPRIGTGLAGGDWMKIEPMLLRLSGNKTTNVYSL